MKALSVRLLLGTLCLAGAASADQVQVAVAANFTKPMETIVESFKQATGHEAKLAFGASGKFVAQIEHGAPFEVFLSADATKPAKLIEKGLAVAETNFTYAQGSLVLWSPKTDYVDSEGKILSTGDFKHIALADPKLAPYGEAALETMTKLNLVERLKDRFVQGESIAQTFQFVQTGNAELGFIALSQVMAEGQIKEGSAWLVPADYYQPIKQEAVLLKKGENSAAAKALLSYLQTDDAKQVILSYGYTLPETSEEKTTQ